MDKPAISVIIPVYNVERYLNDCVNSVINQTFRDYELILINDGSSDESGNICNTYAEKLDKIKVIHKRNGGLSSARNEGLSSASGDFIVFVDSDDILPLNALDTIYCELKNGNTDVVIGSCVRFTEQGQKRDYNRIKIAETISGEKALCLLLEGKKINISVCGGGYKSSLFKGLGFTEGIICEDWELLPKLYSKIKTVKLIPDLLYYYRENPQSIMGNIMKKNNPQVIEVAESVITAIRKNSPHLYLETLWSNIRRVWKYVGFTYVAKRENEESEFLKNVRIFIKRYYVDLIKSKKLAVCEHIGVWMFCYAPIFCKISYRLKYFRKSWVNR